jgi:hypothetical protein
MMSLRETYRCFFPVILLISLLNTGIPALAQLPLLEREINLSCNTAEISQLLKEIGHKGKFSFTYTSQLQTHRIASVLHRKQTVRNHLDDIFRYDSIQILEQNNKILLIPLFKKPKVTFNFRSVKGLVIDGKSRRPLPYTNVFLKNKSTGTISNAAGNFELKVTPDMNSDTIGISHIGYKMVTIPLESLDSAILVVRLSADKVQIKEVVVKPLDPIYILTKAIEKIPFNYDRKPAVFTGFFRESTQQDNKNISLSEAIINIYKEPYTSFRGDQIKIFKGRKGSNTNEKEFVEFIVQGGLFNTLQLDIVKNLPTFLDADYFALYEYQIERIITHFERLTYVIAFDQREGVKYPCYKGKVYIDVATLAIVGASFQLPEKGMNYDAGVFVKKTPRHMGVKPINAHYQVFYRLYNSKWNLSNARSEVLIRVRRRKNKQQDKFNCVFASVSEFVITNKDTANIARFKTDEVSRARDILVEQIGETDIAFWGDENIIIPEEPIEKAIIRLGRRNKIFSEQEIAAIKIEEAKEAEKPPENNMLEGEKNEIDKNGE